MGKMPEEIIQVHIPREIKVDLVPGKHQGSVADRSAQIKGM